MSDDLYGSNQKNDVEEGFTAWVPGVMFGSSSRKQTAGRSRQESSLQEDDRLLREEHWLSEIEEKAKTEGFEAGFARGLEEGREEMAGLRDQILLWADKVADAFEKSLLSHQGVLADIVLESVSRLVGERLNTADGIRDLVEMVLRKRTADLSGTLLVSPGIDAMIDRLDPGLKKELADRHVTVESSQQLSPGEISFRTEFHSASVDPLASLKELEMILREGLS